LKKKKKSNEHFFHENIILRSLEKVRENYIKRKETE
jgi:hypothetical protein